MEVLLWIAQYIFVCNESESDIVRTCIIIMFALYNTPVCISFPLFSFSFSFTIEEIYFYRLCCAVYLHFNCKSNQKESLVSI